MHAGLEKSGGPGKVMGQNLKCIALSGNNPANKAVVITALIINDIHDFTFKAVRVAVDIFFIFNENGQVVGGDRLKQTCVPVPLILDQSLENPALV